MELVYEVADMSPGWNIYFTSIWLVIAFAVVVFITAGISERKGNLIGVGLTLGVLAPLAFVLAPYVSNLSSRIGVGKQESLEQVYENVNQYGDRFTASLEGAYVEGVVTDIGDNRIVVHEFK